MTTPLLWLQWGGHGVHQRLCLSITGFSRLGHTSSIWMHRSILLHVHAVVQEWRYNNYCMHYIHISHLRVMSTMRQGNNTSTSMCPTRWVSNMRHHSCIITSSSRIYVDCNCRVSEGTLLPFMAQWKRKASIQLWTRGIMKWYIRESHFGCSSTIRHTCI